MGLAPDTIIHGDVYKKIDEYRAYEYTRTYFVRSDPSGKGYAWVPDSAAEYVTGDLTAQAGDTVHDVLWSWTNELGIFYSLHNTVVDSVVVLTNAGVTVTRHYVDNNGSLGSYHFWQAGMGTSYGPMLESTGDAGSCVVGDTAMFGYFINGLLPGPIGEFICSVPGLGIGDHIRLQELEVFPNPSTGLFGLDLRVRSTTVYDATGQLLFQTSNPRIDLSAHPPGLYTAVVTSSAGRQAVRLVVER